MDPQVKGAIIGGLGTASALTIGYLLQALMNKDTSSKASTSHELVKHDSSTLNTESDDFIVLLGDVGGTNVRLVLSHIYLSDREKKVTIKE